LILKRALFKQRKISNKDLTSWKSEKKEKKGITKGYDVRHDLAERKGRRKRKKK